MSEVARKFEDDGAAWAWIKADIARAKEGLIHDETLGLEESKARDFDVEAVRANYVEARAAAKGNLLASLRAVEDWTEFLDAFWANRARLTAGEIITIAREEWDDWEGFCDQWKAKLRTGDWIKEEPAFICPEPQPDVIEREPVRPRAEPKIWGEAGAYRPKPSALAPGMVGEIAEYVLANFMYPSPILAVVPGLATVGTLIGQRIAGPSGPKGPEPTATTSVWLRVGEGRRRCGQPLRIYSLRQMRGIGLGLGGLRAVLGLFRIC